MFAVIYIPDFSLQAVLRLTPELHAQPVAIIEDKSSKAPLFQLTQSARDAGVSEGMTSTQALARCPRLVIKTRSVPQEIVTSEALLDCAYSFSPDIEATADGVVTLDLKGFRNLSVEAYGKK
jgi:protein ImuB